MPAASFIRGSLEDQAAAQPLHAAGTPLRQIAAALGWSYGRASEAVRAIRGLPSDNALRQARRGKAAAEVVAANDPVVDPTPPSAPSATRKKRCLPTADEVRARAANDLLTVDWSNWLSDGAWVRDADPSTEVWGEDEDGEPHLSHLAVDPGFLWPVGWDGPSDFRPPVLLAPPARPAKSRVLLTAAQNRTPVHGPALVNLVALAEHYGAEIAVGGYVYGKGLFEAKGGKDAIQIAPYAAAIAEHVTRKRTTLPSGYRFAAEMNTTATAQRPLSGMAKYAKGRSMAFPHPRRELDSVPRHKGCAPVLLWTTGTITVPNYVLKKAGLLALEDHCIGCLMVEEDFEGRVFVRDINFCLETGAAYDLDVHVDRGVVRRASDVHAALGVRGAAAAMGDVHRDHLSPVCARAVWGIGGNPHDDLPLVQALNIGWQFIHDLLNTTAVGHHERHNPWTQFAHHLSGANRIQPEIRQAADFLVEAEVPGCQTCVVYSNHDEHLSRWLRETDWRDDPANAAFYLRANLAVIEGIADGRPVSAFEWALRGARPDADFQLLDCDTPMQVFGVSYQYHGDRSPNGARGSTAGLAAMGVPITKAHDHILSARGGARSNGCLTDNFEYAKGATSWVQGLVLGHPDGERQSIQIVDGKWRA